MKVREIMTPDVEFVSSEDSVKTAAQKMEALNVGALPVKIGEEAFGMITDRDIVVRTVAQGLDPEKHKVMESASEGIVSCNEDDDVEKALKLMEDKQIRRLIVEKDQKVRGILSLGDLAVKVQNQAAGEALKEVSQPAKPAR